MNSVSKMAIQKGFSLIEVLIALVVVVVGLMGVFILQGVFLQSASDSSRRAVAMQIAEKKIEELRHFDGISSGSVATFDAIASGATGVITQDGQAYSWSYDTTLTSVSGASGNAKMKELLLTVSWGSEAGETLQVSSIIGAVNPGFTPYYGEDALGGSTPDISHNPGQTPDVIPISVGANLKKETSKPLPEVSQHGTSNRVNFEVVTYSTDNGTIKEIREDFVTINCTCEFGDGSNLTGSGLTPAYYTWSGSNLVREAQKGIWATKVVGENNLNEQDRICDRCCRDHHDNFSSASLADTSLGYDPWRSASDYTDMNNSGVYDHKHYFGTSAAVDPVVGHQYFEACRFKRINGVYELVQDWRLIDINVMDRQELAASNAQSVYEQYVQTVLAEYVNGNFSVEDFVASAGLPATNFENVTSSALSSTITVAPGSQTQLLSRSIYLEPMDAAHKSYLKTNASGGTVSLNDLSWLETVPFYEVNTTLLSDWSDLVAVSDLNVTNEDVITIVDPAQNYYGTYSRGVVVADGSAVAAVTDTIQSSSELSNSGLTSSFPIDPDDETDLADDTLDVTLDVNSSVKYFTGVFNCINYNNPADKCKDDDYEDLAVSMLGTPAAGSCTVVSLTGNKRGYSCQYTTAGTNYSGSITISYSGGGSASLGSAFSDTGISGAAAAGSFVWSISNVEASSDLDVTVEIN